MIGLGGEVSKGRSGLQKTVEKTMMNVSDFQILLRDGDDELLL